MNEGKKGAIHIISQAILEISNIFEKIGFSIASGPEMEDEWHNFDALNVPKDHPARDMQDTFWLKEPKGGFKINDLRFKNEEKFLLRTHTSSVQIRYMEEKIKEGKNPPWKIIVPGKVFRNEATDATHEAQFHQLEGLYIDKEVSLAHLKGVLDLFFKEFFGKDVETRFRPSFFPFVEPGVEVDVKMKMKDGKEKWLEMAGAGLVHPNVFNAVGLKGHTGFAFGIGIDRLLMVRHQIPDIRLFYNADLRFVEQFK